jgi:hypothetical protein
MHPLFAKGTGTGTAQFLHVGTGAKGESHMVTEGADVSTGIALHAEQDQSFVCVKDFEVPDLTDTQGPLYRAFPWRALVQPPGKFFCHLQDPFTVNITVQPHQADVLLFVLEQQGGKADSIAQHDEEDTGYLRVERSCMPDLAAEHLPNPCGNLVAGGPFWLVNDDDPGPAPDVD